MSKACFQQQMNSSEERSTTGVSEWDTYNTIYNRVHQILHAVTKYSKHLEGSHAQVALHPSVFNNYVAVKKFHNVLLMVIITRHKNSNAAEHL